MVAEEETPTARWGGLCQTVEDSPEVGTVPGVSQNKWQNCYKIGHIF